MINLFLLIIGMMMVTFPLQVKSLIELIISCEPLHVHKSTQEDIISLLRRTLITDIGRVLIGSSACLLLPSTLGYVGAVRESRLLLVLVRNVKDLLNVINL